jgi:pimeloyl-ACP methyl ester carboxylesterase
MFSISTRRAKGVLALAVVTAFTATAGVTCVSASATGGHAHRSSRNFAERPRPTIVLLHGAWADSSSWEHVVALLQWRGYTVDVPPNPLRGVAADSAYIADYLQGIEGPIVLVGHSYGGVVITNAALGDEQVKALVYIDAFIPDEKQTVKELAEAKPGSCLGGEGNPANVFSFAAFPGAPEGDYDLYAKTAANPAYPGFAKCFANDLPAGQGAVLAATQRPLTLNALVEPSGPPAWKSIPSWSFIGTLDQVIPPAEQLAMSSHAGAHVTEGRASHLSMISDPEGVENVILKAVYGVA